MKNAEKNALYGLVRNEKALGHDIKTATSVLKRFGFKPATIRKYYKAISN